jgi:hypothetical protein
MTASECEYASNPPFVLRIGDRNGNFNALLGALRQITVRRCENQGYFLVYIAISPSNCPLRESRNEFICETTESMAASCFR